MTCSTEITFLLLTSFDRSNQAHIAGTLQCVRLYPFQKVLRGAVCELTMPNWGWGECISQRRPRIIPTKRSWSAFCNSCSFTPVSSPSWNIWGPRCPWWYYTRMVLNLMDKSTVHSWFGRTNPMCSGPIWCVYMYVSIDTCWAWPSTLGGGFT